MIPTIIDAIKSLNATTAFSITDNLLDGWDISEIKTGVARPTDAEIATELTRLQAVYDGQAYARSRKAKYDLLNQDEMRFDDQVNSTTTWVDAINAIKAAHPK
jgi:hypothetical protein|tara:strand:- start:1440 stop:1748 length:309 start_codon:yes stop_codon:yes gene_type:complete